MSVRFQYAGDKDISAGRSGGASLFKLPGAISFPAAGSYNSTLYGVEYPVAQGGTSFANPVTAATVPNQICDVDVENDGSGGTYTDWTTATNIQFKAFGNVFYTDSTPQSLDIEVPSGSGNYYQGGTYYNQFFHDGTGGWSSQGINQSYYSNGTDTNIALVGDSQTTEVPSGSGNSFNNGRINGYTWDGNGGYNYPVTKGNYYGNGTDTGLTGLDAPDTIEVPVSSGNYYPTGEIYGYTWDGSGGYISGVQKGTRYANGTLIWESISGSAGSVEVPGGSTNYFDYQYTGDRYTLLDNSYNPPYFYASSWNKPNGTFIYNDGTSNYYWDGTGGYYT